MNHPHDHRPHVQGPLRRLLERDVDICDHLAEHLAEMDLLVQAGELDSPAFRAELGRVKALEFELAVALQRREYIEWYGV